MPFLIVILSGRFVGIMLPSLASFSFSIFSSRRVEVLLLFLGEGVWAFSGLACLLGALQLPGELFQLSQQTLVSEAEHLHLIRISLYSFWCTCRRSAIYVALLVLHPWRIDVAPACVPSGYHQSLRDQFYLYRNCRSHRRRQTNDAFSIGTGLEHAGIAGPVLWLWMSGSSTKQETKRIGGGSPFCISDA